MTILIGIEGGGTSTRLLIERDGVNPEYRERKVSLKFANNDFRGSAERLRAMLEEIIGDDIYATKAIVIGLSGASQAEDQDAYRAELREVLGLPTAPIYIESDASLALRIALPEPDAGVLLIAGTGSTAFLRDVQGQIQRVGGWGPLLGDEGSGTWIGRQALAHFLHVFDGRRTSDALFDKIMQALPVSVSSNPLMLNALLEAEWTLPSIFAPLVTSTVEQSEEAATIMQMAAHHLAELVRRAIQLTGTLPPYQVILAGSVAKQDIIFQRLNQIFFDSHIQYRFLDDDIPVRIALEMARKLVDERREDVE